MYECSVSKGACEVKKIFKIAAKSTPFLLALSLFCANPENKDVKWRTSVDLPITANQKFILGATMDTLFFNKQQVVVSKTYDTVKVGLRDSIFVSHIDTTMTEINAYPKIDSAKKQIPDTVLFGFPARDSVSDTISQDSLEDKYYEDVFGPIPLSGAPTNSVSIPLAGNYTAGTAVVSPAIPLTVKYVFHIDLDTAQNLDLSVTNNSGASFSSVTITLGTLGSSTITNLAANTSKTARFDVGGKSIDSVMNVSISATPSATGTFAAGDNFGANFSLNGLKASKVVVLDSLLANYQRTFTNEYNLTDTVNVNYIDIAKGYFVFFVTNHTSMDLLLTVDHRNLWEADFCIARIPPLKSVENLTGLSFNDTNLHYSGEVAIHASQSPGPVVKYSKQNISGNRLFPEWNPITKKSVTKVDYIVNVKADNKRVTLAASDSLSFVIRTTSFKFAEMYGHSMELYNRVSEPSAIPVKLPWPKAVTDSLRGSFKLQKVLAVSKTKINIPPGAFIDTMLLHYDLTSTRDPSVKGTSDVSFYHVSQDSIFTRAIDITDIVNDFPDSVRVNISMRIPVNTNIKVVNDLTDPLDPSYSKHIGRMIIPGHVIYNLVAPLCWTVVDTTIMDLGGAKVDLSDGSGILNPLGKMDDKHASLNLQVTNSTNLYMRLYALIATDSANVGPLVDTLNAGYIKTNQFNQLVNAAVTPAGYVNLLGNGVLIPPRDSTKTVPETIPLTDQELSQLLKAKTIGMRWEVRFIPQNPGGTVPDALYNTDWLKLNSWIHIDGINGVDALFQ
jgi:hypothetical protein